MWYNTGSITGTSDSNVITGVNTEFTKAIPSIRSGMILNVAGLFCEISYVVNDTELVLVQNLGINITEEAYQIINVQTDLIGLASDFARSITNWNDFCIQYYKLVTSNEDNISFKDLLGISYNLPTYQYIAQHSGLPLVNIQTNSLLQFNGTEWTSKSLSEVGLYTKQQVDTLISNLENTISTMQLTIESMEQRLDALES